MPTTDSTGKLAAALAVAQREFGTVTRDKTVTVTTKTGGQYKFSYAPLESVIAATRPALSAHGLVLVQMLHDGALETTLLHESGESITGSMGLPDTQDIQALGSAVTYLRRYAMQALLGIAAEEDDDGNQAAGNQAELAQPAKGDTEILELVGAVERSGTIAKGEGRNSKLEARQTPIGHHLGFRLTTQHGAIPQVVADGAIGDALVLAAGDDLDNLVGLHVKVSGKLYNVKSTGRRSYYRLALERIESDEWVIPADVAPGQETLSLTDDEKAAIGGTDAGER